MDGLDIQATGDTRHITNTNKKNITENTKTLSNTDPTKKPERESRWSWKVKCLIVPILPLSTIVF
jgi:hypothetical protein